MAMNDLRRVWRAGQVIIVMILAVPGGLMLLQQWGYVADDAATPAMPTSSRTVVAPDFSLRDLDGNVRRLASFRGRVVLLNFWATWCPPCRTEMPLMEALYQAYTDNGFEVVAVSSDVQGAEVVQPFVTQHHLSFTTLLDTTGQVTRLYGVTSLPTTYLLDREGRLVTVAIGSHDWAKADARALIRSLLDTSQQAAVPHGAEAMHGMAGTVAQRLAGGP
jgi:cytochrome c biogenesis protein CcmG, thiol:disulfide interchange protein DsbE